jgi:hypothetical protein
MTKVLYEKYFWKKVTHTFTFLHESKSLVSAGQQINAATASALASTHYLTDLRIKTA